MDEERNEVMEIEIDTENEQEEREESGSKFGLGLIIGAALPLAVFAGIKGVQKLIAKHKAKKEESFDDDWDDEGSLDDPDCNDQADKKQK